jgi:hypothetical protein
MDLDVDELVLVVDGEPVVVDGRRGGAAAA